MYMLVRLVDMSRSVSAGVADAKVTLIPGESSQADAALCAATRGVS